MNAQIAYENVMKDNLVRVVDGSKRVYRADGALIVIEGKLPDGSYGIKVAREKIRIYAMDCIIQYYHLTKEQINKAMGES